MTRIRPILFPILEITIILVFIFVFTPQLRADFAGDTIPPGAEYPHLINSGALASLTFRQNGAIPLWNPLMGNGEPLFENQFSYLLNPFMSYPILFWGEVQGGKIAILLHIVIMALGGWALGRALRLNHGGAVLLGLLLAASGGLNTGLNRGFYQTALSLAYVPWVYAGLIGLLYREQPRRWTGVFVVATLLLLFAGTIWFALPTALGCALIVLFALRRLETPTIRRERVKRLAVAGAFGLGFASLLLIPRLNSWLVFSPTAGLGSETWDLLTVLRFFFVNEKLIPTDVWYAYHYTIPGWFALLVVIVRFGLGWWESPFARWRIVIPAFILILFFCVWAQDNTPLFRLLYDHTFFAQWRLPVRMAAAATPFVALIAALWFDEAVRLLAARNLLLKLGAVALAGVGLYAASLVYWNWENMFHFEPYPQNLEYFALEKLRADHPGAFLSVRTEGLPPHVVVHELLVRSTTGNPEVFTNGLPSAPAFEDAIPLEAQFAIAYNDGFINGLIEQNYTPYPGAPLLESGESSLWFNAEAPPYAFLIQRETLARNAGLVTPATIQPVAGMEHHLDRIVFTLDTYKFNSVLVVQEINYPGWSVTVNGQPTAIESFDGYLAVSLPLDTETVIFEYHAPLLVVGTVVYCVTLILFAGYLLRGDDRFRRTNAVPPQTETIRVPPEPLPPLGAVAIAEAPGFVGGNGRFRKRQRLKLIAALIMLSLFAARQAVPMVGDCPVFPEDNPWNIDISAYPVDANSDAYIASISADGDEYLHADFGEDPDYGIPYVLVDGAQPLVPITFTEYGDESDPGPYPVPDDAPVEAGNDAHVLVVDGEGCMLYEMYHAEYNGEGWDAGSGAVFDLRSNDLRPEGWTSADAAGLPIFPGLVRYDEIEAGAINHALRFTVSETQRAYIHPATHYASNNDDPDLPPMGLRLRLRADYDISEYTGMARVILEALKTYGMIVADNGTSWFISGATDSRWDDDDLNQLKDVPGAAFEVVETDEIVSDE